MGFNLADYEEVKDRIPRFWEIHPTGSIRTTRLPSAEGEWVVLAALHRAGEDEPFATGLAHEVSGAAGVNKTSALENCETSAIGRALANGGFASGKHRPSREEMTKPVRSQHSHDDGPTAPDSPPKAESPENACKRLVVGLVHAEQPAWTERMVADTCKRLWSVALRVSEKEATVGDAKVIADTILDLFAAEKEQ